MSCCVGHPVIDSFSYLSTVMFRGSLVQDGNARFTIVPLKPCVYFCEFLHCFFITRNALVTLPQMKINSLKKQND